MLTCGPMAVSGLLILIATIVPRGNIYVFYLLTKDLENVIYCCFFFAFPIHIYNEADFLLKIWFDANAKFYVYFYTFYFGIIKMLNITHIGNYYYLF